MALNGRDAYLLPVLFSGIKTPLGDLEAKLEEEGQGDAYELLTRNAESVAAGSEGLFFLPYLSG